MSDWSALLADAREQIIALRVDIERLKEALTEITEEYGRDLECTAYKLNAIAERALEGKDADKK